MIFSPPRDRLLIYHIVKKRAYIADCNITIALRSLHARRSLEASYPVQQRHPLNVSGLGRRACPYLMPSTCRAQSTASTCSFGLHSALWISLILFLLWVDITHGMTDGEIQGLRYEGTLSADGMGHGC